MFKYSLSLIHPQDKRAAFALSFEPCSVERTACYNETVLPVQELVKMSKIEVINTDKAPAAIGPYVQGKIAGGFLFASGQVPLDPVTGAVVGSDITEQAHRAMQNVKALVEAAGATMADVVKTTCFLHDINDFAAFNEVYASYMGESAPARSCVGGLSLPKGVLCEVEVVVYLG